MVLKFAQCGCLPCSQRPRLIAARCAGELLAGTTELALRWPSVPRLLWSGASPAPRRRLHHCGAAAAASRHAAPPALRRDQARRRPATRPPAPLRVQVHHARRPPVEPAEPFGLKAPTAASRSPMHAALARSPESQRQPVGVHAAGPDTNCGPTFRARAPREAPPRRAAAPEEKFGPGGAQGEPDWPRRSTPKCSTGKTFFVGNLAKRVKPVSDHVDHEVFPLFTEAFLTVYPANVRPRRPGGAVAPRWGKEVTGGIQVHMVHYTWSY